MTRQPAQPALMGTKLMEHNLGMMRDPSALISPRQVVPMALQRRPNMPQEPPHLHYGDRQKSLMYFLKYFIAGTLPKIIAQSIAPLCSFSLRPVPVKSVERISQFYSHG
jgi:hypothetical protein